MPSPAAQRVIHALRGETLVDRSGALGGGRFRVGSFGVLPNPRSTGGKGPVISLEPRAGGPAVWLPVETDGDVGDFYRRVRAQEPPAALGGPQSAPYRETWAAPEGSGGRLR